MTICTITGLVSEKGKMLNEQMGQIIGYDSEKKRYDLRMHYDKSIKQIKFENLEP